MTRENWLQPQNLRWALRHSRQVVPYAVIGRGDRSGSESNRPVSPLPQGAPIAIDDLTFTDAGQSIRVGDFLQRSRVDATIVLHRGLVVYERYFEGMTADQPHQWASMTKSITGLLAAVLIEQGVIDPDKPVSDYVPELSMSPFGTATVQQSLNMQVAVDWPEEVTELHWMVAVGLLPNPGGVPESVRSFLPLVGRHAAVPHGSTFRYLNSPTEAVAWALCNATDRSWPRLVEDEIWSKLGAEQDATVIVDAEGTAQASGGFSSCALDLARFAELARTGGHGTGLSPAAIARWTAPHPDPTVAGLFARGNITAGRPGFSYRNGLFHVNDGDGSLQMSGRFGQRVHVNPAAGMTVVQFASFPGHGEETAGAYLQAMKSITERLRRR